MWWMWGPVRGPCPTSPVPDVPHTLLKSPWPGDGLHPVISAIDGLILTFVLWSGTGPAALALHREEGQGTALAAPADPDRSLTGPSIARFY